MGRRVSPLAAAMIIGVAALAGILIALTWKGGGDSERAGIVVPLTGAVPPSDASGSVSAAVGSPGQTPQPSGSASPQPSTPSTSDGSVGPFDISDDVIDRAIAEAAGNPLIGLPSRDELATADFENELTATGVDLTGTEITIYPASSGPAFVLFETDDASPALAQSDGQRLLDAVLASPSLTTYGVQELVFRHHTTDEQGPATYTIIVGFAALRDAMATGADVSSQFAAQVTRP